MRQAAVHSSPVQPLSCHCTLSAEPCALQGVLEPGAEEELQLTVWINGGSEGTAQLVAGTQVGPASFWPSCLGFSTRVAIAGQLGGWHLRGTSWIVAALGGIKCKSSSERTSYLVAGMWVAAAALWLNCMGLPARVLATGLLNRYCASKQVCHRQLACG